MSELVHELDAYTNTTMNAVNAAVNIASYIETERGDMARSFAHAFLATCRAIPLESFETVASDVGTIASKAQITNDLFVQVSKSMPNTVIGGLQTPVNYILELNHRRHNPEGLKGWYNQLFILEVPDADIAKINTSVFMTSWERNAETNTTLNDHETEVYKRKLRVTSQRIRGVFDQEDVEQHDRDERNIVLSVMESGLSLITPDGYEDLEISPDIHSQIISLFDLLITDPPHWKKPDQYPS